VAIILIKNSTRHSVPVAMRVTSEVKAITMAEEMALLNKTRIVLLADAIESTAVVFNGCGKIRICD
jgi:hypothetical protein